MATAQKLLPNDVTQCKLCAGSYNDPRTLPCTHNFCLQCLSQHCSDQLPGKMAPCPLCTTDFTVPTNGVKGLPKNFFLERLIQLKKLMGAQNEQWPCEPCSVHEIGDDEETKVAAFYCTDCQEKQCESCASLHRKQKATRGHKQVRLGDKINLDDVVSKSSIQTCNKHVEEQLKFYCIQCKTAICFACYIEFHNAHKCSNFSEIADDYRNQMTADTNEIPCGIEKCRERMSALETDKQSLSELCKRLENDICDRAELIRQTAERHKMKLLSELDAVKRDRGKEIDQIQKKLRLRITSLECLKTYSEELVSKGTETDIARETSVLHDRAQQLLNFDDVQMETDAMGTINVSFAASSVHTGDDENIVGNVSSKWTFACPMKLTHTLPSTGYYIVGVTTLNDELFVARNKYDQIAVYDTTKFELVRSLSLGYNYYWGLASCTLNNCIYVACNCDNLILKIDLSTYSVSHQWSSAVNPMGLSVNAESEVLVACNGAHKLQKYKNDGTVIQDVNLLAIGISNPVHAVQLSTGNYIVGHGSFTSMQGLSEVSADGSSVVRKYQPPSNQLSGYVALSVKGKQGNVLVCGGKKNTIQVLDYSLTKPVELSLPIEIGGLQLPVAIHFDDDRRRLFLGEWSGRRVIVVDHVVF